MHTVELTTEEKNWSIYALESQVETCKAIINESDNRAAVETAEKEISIYQSALSKLRKA